MYGPLKQNNLTLETWQEQCLKWLKIQALAPVFIETSKYGYSEVLAVSTSTYEYLGGLNSTRNRK